MVLPDVVESEFMLDEVLTRPSTALVEMMARLDGDIMILGAGGKMGPSLAILAKRASAMARVDRKVYAVSRFSDPGAREGLEKEGVLVLPSDLLNPGDVASLPWAKNVIFMAGRKFGVQGSEPTTWMINVVVPRLVADHFRGSRTVVFSTGCVYPLVSAATGGSRETDEPGPVGEYATSCLGRERVFEWHAGEMETPTLQFRLNYAVDLRYGILVDIARKVWEEEPVDLSVNSFNCIWQGDANERALRCLEHTTIPSNVLNVTGGELLRVDEVAERFGEFLGKAPSFVGSDKDRAYLANAEKSMKLFGKPNVDTDRLINWVADWIRRGGTLHDKPTLFQVTDGDFSKKDV
ncbi:MAG: epimerase [Candidatus Sumerlaeia bacterium]|nr:epimerase [Candidatus Sumerlaeia bacterium]